ncbi:MAG: hypothetical protein QOF89_3491 [Acidobacteriota bacterium]|jgi:hypothetical protein|nr:hypothetical protein [Acidobacteriota bacterium]
MGGFAAAHQDVAGVVLIETWNVGADGKDLRAHPEMRAAAIAEIGDDFGNSLGELPTGKRASRSPCFSFSAAEKAATNQEHIS